MDAIYEPGSYEAARVEADEEMVELAAVFSAYLAEEVAPRITSHFLEQGVLPGGMQWAFESQEPSP